jgi:thiol-disulfide isomerase/thioredoxin
MFRYFRFHATAAVAALFLFAGLAPAANAAEDAPRFRAKTLDGEEFTKESLKGKVVLVQFWTTWCPHCKEDQPAVDNILRDFFGQGLVVLAVNVGESKKTVRKYLDQSPRACKIVLTEDANLAAMFAANSFPLYVLIDRDGKLAGKQNGSGGEEALRQLLQNAGLATPNSRMIGRLSVTP